MDLEKLTNSDLVRLCGREPSNAAAWMEFHSRFDKRIRLVVYRECRQKQLTRKERDFASVFQDLVQDIYFRLLENDGRALREFKGASENSIFVYLGVIARNVVRNHLIALGAQKRPEIARSLDEPLSEHDEGSEKTLKDRYRALDLDLESELDLIELKEEIDEILRTRLVGKNGARDGLVFRLAMYEGFTPKEIASQFGLGISAKTVGNVLSSIKQLLREELQRQHRFGGSTPGAG